MADDADLSDGYAERIVQESLYLLQNRKQSADAICTHCEEYQVELLPNGVYSQWCTRCRKEIEAERMAAVLPVSVVPEQGDGPEDSWQETMIPSRRYRRKWFLYLKVE